MEDKGCREQVPLIALGLLFDAVTKLSVLHLSQYMFSKVPWYL